MQKVIFLLVLFFFTHNLFAKEEYFLTLRNETVNLRQGPSFDYPVKIFYKKKFLLDNQMMVPGVNLLFRFLMLKNTPPLQTNYVKKKTKLLKKLLFAFIYAIFIDTYFCCSQVHFKRIKY